VANVALAPDSREFRYVKTLTIDGRPAVTRECARSRIDKMHRGGA
jgi:hypothetical protein